MRCSQFVHFRTGCMLGLFEEHVTHEGFIIGHATWILCPSLLQCRHVETAVCAVLCYKPSCGSHIDIAATDLVALHRCLLY